MATAQELSGYFTYRSFINRPEPVEDFNRIRFAEADVFLLVADDGTVTGTLGFPAGSATTVKSFMDLSGRVVAWNPLRLAFTGKGRPDTAISDFEYGYEGEVTPAMPAGIGQRLAIAGTVVRLKDHGSGDTLAKAGATASFVAVKRDHIEARDTPGFGLIEPAKTMLASKLHRLHHTVWHTLRSVWWDPLNDDDRKKVKTLNWDLVRPPFAQAGGLDLLNGAGEDFLFMHRRMIKMVRDIYASAGAVSPQGWKALPPPGVAQLVFSEKPDPEAPGKKIYDYDATRSGFMIPPATGEYLSVFPETQRPGLAFLKTPQFFSMVMAPHARLFTRASYLATLPLGALGNLLEFTIHNQMHMRWTAPPRDPSTGAIAARGDFDFGDTWNDARNDYLGDFYSSHVSPVFWRLHGWVDDRINDWFAAQQAARPGAVKTRTHKGVDWFEPGDWVATAEPFDQPAWWDEHGGHGHGHDDQKKIDEMLAVMDVIKTAQDRPATPAMAEAMVVTRRNLTSFADQLMTMP